jgi:hypothetical protein
VAKHNVLLRAWLDTLSGGNDENYPASLKRSAFGSKRERKISASSGSSKQ